jgi:threonine aldolase
MGKEAGLFVPSGTMGNLAALLAHCGRGDEIILGDMCHSFIFEAGGSAALGGIHPRTLPNRPDGTLDLAAVEGAVRADNVHFPPTRLIALENTHNRAGGAVLDLEYMRSVRAIADRHGLRVHLDGARLFNAAAHLDIAAHRLAADADSVTFCLSKGLAAPVGSVLCGEHDFIDRARRARKMLGGGMRQAGILAAAGIVALETMVDRLVEDHIHAQRLARGLAELPGILLDPETVQTNIVIFDVADGHGPAAALVEAVAALGVKVIAITPTQIRAVTYWEVTAADIEHALEAFRKALAPPSG